MSVNPQPAFSLRSSVHWLMLPSIALLAVLPLVVHGYSCGHDFDFHLVSWFEAAQQMAHGTLHPHWAYTPAWNAGEPRFVFYPPLSWYLGALLGLILPWGATPLVYTWLCLTASGLACLHLLEDFTPPRAALAIAALYTVNPYMLFTAYERTAYGELLCAAWLPLLLHGILRERVTVPRIAVPLALLWLTNAPAAVLATYSLALLAGVRLFTSRDRISLAANTIAGTVLGFGLAAFYIVPAASQRRFIDRALAQAQSSLITDNFLFHHTADAAHDAVLHTASLIAVGFLLVAFSGLLGAAVYNPAHRKTLAPLAVLCVVIAFLLTPLSTAIWIHAPNLAFLQFPWRFVAILSPAAALLLALTFSRTRSAQPYAGSRHAIQTGFVAFPIIALCFHVFYQRCDEQDTVAARLALFHSTAGTEGTDDYIPNTVDDPEALGRANPPFWLAPDAEGAPPPAPPAGPLPGTFDLTLTQPEVLILNLRDYPAWQLTRNGQLLAGRLPRPDGLIATPLPAGPAHLALTYVHTPDQTAGNVVSVIAVAALFYLLLRRRRS